MSSTKPERADLGAGARLALRLPADALEEPESALPVIPVAGLPGASIALRRGWKTEDGLVLRAACVKAPSDRWAPGIEELVLERATGLARGAVPGEVRRWVASAARGDGDRFEQDLEGEAALGSEVLSARGRHFLGFAGEARDVVVCSVVCAEPKAAARCGELVGAAAAEGAFTAAPPPSLLVRVVLFAAERPREAGALAGALAVLLVALVLARRPRPRP